MFASSDGGKSFAAVAVLGISAGENLFYSDAWARNVYVPAYARRYPFCMAKVTLDKVEQKNRLICIEKSSIDEESGEAMFDAAGEPFTMQATLNKDKGGAAMHLTGMHRIAEKNLENLNAAQLKNLMRKGLLARIYMHLLSLDNFARLLERKASRTTVAESPTSG